MKPANSVLSGYGTSVFEVMSRLAIERQAINLGQGFPDEEGPDSLKRIADEAGRSFPNQYPPMLGVPELRQAVAAHNARFYGLECDWQREVMVTSGATEALAACILALVEPGDEVVVFDPLYDSYLPMLRRAGAVPRVVRLNPPDWALPRAALAEAFSDRTKLILLNTPMNPTGKVFDAEDLGYIAGLMQKHDSYAICDEVYEHLVFDGEHVPLASLPGMRERTIVISSAGKSFSFTGWKIGHTCAPTAITKALRSAHQFITFCNGTPFQRAMVHGFRAPDSYFEQFLRDYRARRDKLCEGLAEVGFEVLTPAGTYFIQTDIRPLGWQDDFEFCRMLPEKIGVAAIPTSAFYSDRAAGKHLVRWAFCKTDAVLDEALVRLKKLRRA